MKKIIMTASLVSLFILFGVFGSVSVSAQPLQAAPPLPLVPGKTARIRLATDDEKERLFQASTASASTTSVSNGTKGSTSSAPVFALDSYGNPFGSGITVNAINVNVVSAGTYFGGINIGNHEYYIWYAEEDIPAGYIWYGLDYNRNLASSERGRVIEYRLIVFTPTGNGNGAFTEYSTRKNFGVSGVPTRQMVRNHAVQGVGTNAIITLSGSFVGPVGVLLHIPDLYTIAVPQNAITIVGSSIRINLSEIEGSYFPAGDYRVTVVDSSRYSDNGYQFRMIEQ